MTTTTVVSIPAVAARTLAVTRYATEAEFVAAIEAGEEGRTFYVVEEGEARRVVTMIDGTAYCGDGVDPVEEDAILDLNPWSEDPYWASVTG